MLIDEIESLEKRIRKLELELEERIYQEYSFQRAIDGTKWLPQFEERDKNIHMLTMMLSRLQTRNAELKSRLVGCHMKLRELQKSRVNNNNN